MADRTNAQLVHADVALNMQNWLNWLNSNSGAVQGVSAVILALLTALIARLTARYVSLTKTIAESAQRQVQIAELQAQTARNLEAASRQQQELERQRSEEAKAREQAAAELARRQLSSMAARFLAQFAGFSSRPSETVFRVSAPITEADIEAMREAARVGGIDAFDKLEGALSALMFMAELQQRVKNTNPGAGYAFSSPEAAMYAANLHNLRSGLREFTDFRPISEEY